MQALDILLLIVVVCLALWHCYKKGKFPFRFLAKNKQVEVTEKEGETAKTATPPPFPNMPQGTPYNPQYPPYIINGMGNIQSFPPLTAPQQTVTASATATAPRGIDYVKLIPWTVDGYDPLPFGTTQLDLDNAIQSNLPEIGLTLNAEITAIQCDGYSVTAVNVVTLPIEDGIRLLFILSCSNVNVNDINQHNA